MSPDTPPLMRQRVLILHRYFRYACDDCHPFQPQDLIQMRQKFVGWAKLQKVPDEHKWLLKIADAFRNAVDADTSRDRLAIRETAWAIFDENREHFLNSNPDACTLGVQKMTVPGTPGLLN